MLENWVVEPVSLPLVRRNCHVCPSESFRTSGKFRVNAHHKLIDVWLLALCTACGETTKIAVMERMNVRAMQPEMLDRLHDNDAGLAAEVLQDPVVRRRNHIALDWDDAWRLGTDGPDHAVRADDADDADAADRTVVDVSVRFAAQIPVRPARLIAEGCNLSRGEVERLMSEGRLISDVRLNGKLSSDFAFTLVKH